MNAYDSQKIVDLMHNDGYVIVDDISDAEVIVINTCNVREKATEKLYSDLGRIRVRGSNAIVVVAGCVAQAEGDEIFKRADNVDIVVGPQSIHNLPSMINDFAQGRVKKIDIEFPEKTKFDFLPKTKQNINVSSFLSIQEGCDKFCHFCCVPYTRGAEYSRPIHDIIAEAEQLISGGARELTLLGQNVNAYRGWDGKRTVSLGYLLKQLARIDGLLRLRYVSSHPMDMHEELYETHQYQSKVMPFLHLPIQSGSNKILQAMNRKHDTNQYLSIIQLLRSSVPGMQFSSDFIVGYPGESEEDFDDTLSLVKAVNYAQAFSFRYSARPGTPAAIKEETMPVSADVKHKRLLKLQQLLNMQQHSVNNSLLDSIVPVLFEKYTEKGQIVGRTPYMQLVYVEDNGVDAIGKELPVRITKCLEHSLIGEI